MDSYMLAKADSQQFPLSEGEIKDTPYTIQVASYINEKDAVSHVDELKLQEKNVIYFPSFVRGQVWFKVCVGKFSKKEKAEEYRRAFIKRMDEPFAVVISLLDRPKSKEASTTASVKAPAAKIVAATESHMKTKSTADKRKPASVAKKESAKLPLAGSHAAKSHTMPEVKLIPKSEVAESKSVVTRSAAHKYSLQIGAYDKEELVKEKMRELALKHHEVYYKSARVNGKQWYRLFVGKFETKAAAENFKKEYSKATEGAESFIRRVTASE